LASPINLSGNIVWMSSAPSTNDVAWEEGQAEWKERGARAVSVHADAQTGGRGRAGRAWSSPAGGFYFSTYLRLEWEPARAALLTLAAGLAARTACEEVSGIAPDLKWPNDLLAPDRSGRKLGGILTETRSEGGKIIEAVIGVGINVRTPPSGYAVDAAADPVALDAFLHGEDRERLRPAALVDPYLLALGDEIGRLDHADGPADIVARCRAASPLWGRRVHVDQGGRTVEGLAKDLAEDGGLVVRLLSGAEVVIHAGDVRVVWEET